MYLLVGWRHIDICRKHNFSESYYSSNFQIVTALVMRGREKQLDIFFQTAYRSDTVSTTWKESVTYM